MDLQEAFDAGFEAVKSYMDDTFAAFEKRLEALESRQPEKGEPGRDGKDADPEAMAAMVSEAVDKAVAAIPAPQNGKDGRDGLDAVTPLLKDGVLFFTMSDGTVKEVGKVAGENGKDGEPGKDGLGFDDMDLVVADDGVALVFERDGEKKAFALPVVIDRGVFKAGTEYRKGNGVTWGGQFWIAQKDSPEGKPDASSDWRLAVKKGRDSRPAKVEV